MALPILSTKLHLPPPLPGVITRSHLLEKIEDGRRGKLILISAPAGFGKTTLISEWAAQRKGKRLLSWVQLEESDNELVRFLSYLIAALQIHREDLGEAALAGLNSSPPPSIEAVMTSLINDLDSLAGVLYLILDDYHLIDTPTIHEALLFLIDHLPAHGCLIIGTRSDPPFPLHRWRARGQLTEIRSEDLRFSSKETRSYLEGAIDYNFSSQEIEALDNRIEGWIAGLQMLALSMSGKQELQGYISNFSGSHRFLMDYLSEEILEQQPPDIQEFLLRTSFLERLCSELCDAVLSPVDFTCRSTLPVNEILNHLEAANLFLLPLDDERRWYRYHRLFSNLLRQRMRLTWPKEISPALQHAALWCEAHDYTDEAMRYFLAAEDYPSAARLVEREALELLKRGALAPLLEWLDMLPEQTILESGWLCVYKSWALLLSGRLENLEGYLTTVERKPIDGDEGEDQRGHIAAIRAYATSLRGEVERALTLAQEALDLLAEDNLTVRCVVTFVMGGLHMLQQEMPQALESMKEAGRMGKQAGNIHLAVSAMGAAGDLTRMLGNPEEAETIFNQALELGTGRGGQPLPMAARVYSSLADLHLERDNLRLARHFADTGLELSNQWGNMDSLARCYLVQAEIARRDGNIDKLRQSLDEVKRIAAAHSLTPGFEQRIAALEEDSLSQKKGQTALIDPLTDRELEVLRLMVDGCSNKEIGEQLIISLGTVKAHTSSIYRKLEARSRAQAVIKARELGLG